MPANCICAAQSANAPYCSSVGSSPKCTRAYATITPRRIRILPVDPAIFLARWQGSPLGRAPGVTARGSIARSGSGGHEIGETTRQGRGGVVSTMKWRPVVWFLVAALAVTASVVSAQPRRTITLWYPAGDIAAGPVSPFTDPNLFANLEATNNVRVEMVGVDYDTMVQKIFAAAAGRNIADILFIDTSWLPGFLKEDLLQQMDSAKARKWLADVVPDVVDLSDYGNGAMWGYPQMGYDIYGLTWNKAQFKEAGLDPERPPGTWAIPRAPYTSSPGLCGGREPTSSTTRTSSAAASPPSTTPAA